MNARGVKSKRKKRKETIKPDDPAQSERFLKAAQELGLGEDGIAFDRAMDAIAKGKPIPKK